MGTGLIHMKVRSAVFSQGQSKYEWWWPWSLKAGNSSETNETNEFPSSQLWKMPCCNQSLVSTFSSCVMATCPNNLGLEGPFGYKSKLATDLDVS
jgi:hypothetical protein